MKTIKRPMVLLTAVLLFFISAPGGHAALADSFNYIYTDGTGVSATGTLTGALTAPGEYTLTSGTITLTGAPPCTNCGRLSGPLNGTGILVSPPPQPLQVGGGTELIGLDNLLFPGTDPQLDTNGGLAFQMSSGLGIGIGGNGPGNYWIFGGNWSLNNNNGIFTATTAAPSSCSLVSDTSDTVNGAPAALVATPYNPGWTASIPGASWIWDAPTVDNPLINESFTFIKTFFVSGAPSAAMLDINADNSYGVLLNGVNVGSNPGEANYTIGSEGQFNVAGSLRDGTNTLAITVTNFGLSGSTPASNPAGLLYQLAITGATCNVLTIPQEADLSITKTADVTSTTEGGIINYTIAVTDNGPATSTDVVATDTLPSSLTFASAITSGGLYASSTGTWTIGEMAVSSTATLQIQATANNGTAGSTITNTATVGEDASITDPNTANNTASVSVEVSTSTPVSTATIVATKIICPSASDFPDLSGTGTRITSSTAADFIAANPECSLVAGWNFQWGASTVSDPDVGGDFIGSAATSTGWNTFGPTDDNGETTVIVANPTSTPNFWVREDLQPGYIPFSFYPGNDVNSTSSAEVFCDSDVLNYDNLDRVDSPTAGGTYYCVAWNALAASAAPPNLKFIFANTTSSAVTSNGATFNIEAVDASGTIDTSFEQGVTLTVSGSGSGGGLVSIINGVGTSTVNDHTAETVTLGLEDSQSTGLNVNSTTSIMFVPGAVTQFTLNHPGDMNENTRLGYTLGREDQFGNLVSTGATVAYLYSNATSPDAAFFDAAIGGNEIASTTLRDGSTSTQFWYYDDLPGSRTITASDNSSAPDGPMGIVDASDTFMVAPGAVKFVFENIPTSTTVDAPALFNVYAVDSSDTLYPSFDGGVTITTSGSATGGGLVTIVNGIGTTTIMDTTAETVTLGLRDTENTGLGVVDTAQIAINALPITPLTIPSLPSTGEGPGPSSGTTLGIQPGITLTFSGMAYPGATVTVIRKDMGTAAAATTQAIPVATDGSFLITLNNVTRLTGQTYLLSFVDKNGLIAQTKAYNIPVLDKLVHGNILAAPTLGFENTSVITKNQPLVITGYATPNATVELFIDGNPAGTVLVKNSSGVYTYTLSTDGLALGRHAVWAIQVYAQNTVEVSGYTNSLSQDEIFADNSTIGTLLLQNASGTYSFALAASESEGGFRPVTVGAPYIKQAESDFSNQQSFTISPLADPKLDLNGDGVIDIGDLSIFLSYLKNLNANLTTFHITDPTIVKTLDFNGDGVVDIKDLDILEAAIASSTAP